MRFVRITRVCAGFVLGVALSLDAGNALAQFRNLPANGKRATLNGYQNPFVTLGSDQLKLAPGAVIFDTHNRTIVPMSLPPQADVVYTTDQTGAVMRIYLLSPQEQQKLDQAKR